MSARREYGGMILGIAHDHEGDAQERGEYSRRLSLLAVSPLQVVLGTTAAPTPSKSWFGYLFGVLSVAVPPQPLMHIVLMLW